MRRRAVLAVALVATVVIVALAQTFQFGEAAPLAGRVEKSGDTVFCYATDPAPLLANLARHELRYLHRPADLEDVFLKLTGRELRD